LHSGGLFNFGTFRRSDSSIDALYNAALAADDMDRLCADLMKLDTYLLDQALVVPLYQMKMVYGMRKNIRFNPGMNDMPLRLDRIRFVE
jgi:ABC-type oligopeptide transport system substrate-binding subunit